MVALHAQDDEVEGGHSGEFQGEQYFRCSTGHGLFLPVDRLKWDDRFDEDDVETEETRRLLGSLHLSTERDTLHQQQRQASGLSNQSTLDALKELEAARLSSRPYSDLSCML